MTAILLWTRAKNRKLSRVNEIKQDVIKVKYDVSKMERIRFRRWYIEVQLRFYPQERRIAARYGAGHYYSRAILP